MDTILNLWNILVFPACAGMKVKLNSFSLRENYWCDQKVLSAKNRFLYMSHTNVVTKIQKRKERIMQKQFSLISEPWVKVVDLQNSVKELSLKDVFAQAQEIRCLAGELSNQDFALLRLLLAIMQTVVYRYEPNGKEQLLTDPQEALKRWKSIWEKKTFPMSEILNYFSKWDDRFWLIHPEYPFYQIPKQIEGKPGTAVSPGRLIGSIGESDNKARISSGYSTSGKRGIDNAEIARWIIHFQAYDTKATKNSRGPVAPGREKPHPRIGWCGNLAGVYLEGKNLFETIMLNLVLLRTDTEEDACFAYPKPAWERDTYDPIEDHMLETIDNQAELLTLQGRWLYVNRQPDTVIASAVVGENLDPKNAFIEQMTLWKPIYVKSKAGPVVDGFVPSQADYMRQSVQEQTVFGRGVWNRFSAMFSDQNDARRPGVVLWVQRLMASGILPENTSIAIRNIDTVYHKQQGSTVMDIKTGRFDTRIWLLGEQGLEWRKMLTDVIQATNWAAELFGRFYVEANEIAGHPYNGDTFGTKLEGAEIFYGAIDSQFRIWLSQIQNQHLGADEAPVSVEMAREKWEATMFRILDQCARQKIKSCGTSGIRIKESDETTNGYTGLASIYDKLWFTLRKTSDLALSPLYWNMRVKSNRAFMIRDYVREKIQIYQKRKTDPEIIRELAKLRRCVGRRMEENMALCDWVLKDFPEDYKSDRGYTKAERAVFYTLALYAASVNTDDTAGNKDEISFGCAVRRAATAENSKDDPDEMKTIVRYLNRILTADNLDILMQHVVHLSRVVKLKFDYAWFAYDLFTIQIDDYQTATRLMWSADFLRNRLAVEEEVKKAEK